MYYGKIEEKQKAIELRVKERLSTNQIAERLNISKNTIANWMKGFPLTKEEKGEFYRKSWIGRKKTRGEQSKFSKMLGERKLDKIRKGKVAEAAVIYRLALHEFDIFTAVAGTNKVDLLVWSCKTKKVYKIQVRLVMETGCQPSIRLGSFPKMLDGKRKLVRYSAEECDFIVGYDLFTDTAYVYSLKELEEYKKHVTVSKIHAERWDKLL